VRLCSFLSYPGCVPLITGIRWVSLRFVRVILQVNLGLISGNPDRVPQGSDNWSSEQGRLRDFRGPVQNEKWDLRIEPINLYFGPS
jgi:hypothetical protein